jgi:hypothetical protein
VHFKPGFREDCRQTFRNRAPDSRIRLDANAIIDGWSNPLLAAEVAFGRLHHGAIFSEGNVERIHFCLEVVASLSGHTHANINATPIPVDTSANR